MRSWPTIRSLAAWWTTSHCAAGVDKVISLIGEAAAGGARLVAFPETFVPGYPWWIWLDSPAAGMRFVPRYLTSSMTRDGAEIDRILQAAARHDIHVVLGFSERSGGSLYMAQAFISGTGELISVRRKLKPTHVERSVFGEGDGSDLQVHDTALGRLGGLNCWEHLQPLTKYAMYSQGEEIHVGAWPSFSIYRGGAQALGPEVNTAASLIYAVEGQTFVVAPCGVIGEAALEQFEHRDDVTITWRSFELDPEAPADVIGKLGGMSKMIGATTQHTVNPTGLKAGYKVNVIPQTATAELDGRFLPGREEEFFAEIDRLLGTAVSREFIHHDIALETTPDGHLWDAMSAALSAEDPDATVVPYCLSAGTDAKWFSKLGVRCFGFSPLRLPPELDFSGMFHGVDERVTLDGLRFGVRVLDRLLDIC